MITTKGGIFMHLPNYIKEILQILNDHGKEAFVVGGSIRDFLLNLPVHDYDITTNALPQESITFFKNHHYEIDLDGIKHGSIRLLKNGKEVELTTYREEFDYFDHRHPSRIQFNQDLLTDLKRRDFTMNAIAYHPNIGFIDPYQGIDDINNQIIRSINDPNIRFEEDALRILRALRFAYTLHFELETSLKEAIINKSYLIDYISKNRIRDEFCKMLMGNEENLLQKLRNFNILDKIIPGYEKTYFFPQHNVWHIYDVFTHCDVALNHTKGYPLNLKLTMVFHDIGKPQAHFFDQQNFPRFHKHPYYSAILCREIMENLQFDNKTINEVVRFVEDHDYRLKETKSDVRKLLARYDFDYKKVMQLFDIQIADNYAKNLKLALPEIQKCMRIKKMIIDLQQEESPLTLKELCINGNDLLALGYKGKEIKTLLQQLHDYVLDDPKNNQKAILLQYLETLN